MKWAVTLLVYQPLLPFGEAGTGATEIVGGVLSILNDLESEPVFPARSLQEALSCTAVPSPLVVSPSVQLFVSIPDVWFESTPGASSLQYQLAETSLRHQPLLPSVPPKIGASCGAVWSILKLTCGSGDSVLPATSTLNP